MALFVDARVGVSKIHGLGLIAHEAISAGSLVWQFIESIDHCLSANQIEKLPPQAHSQMLNYAYRSGKGDLYILCGDDARFMNHSDSPNCKAGIGDMVGCTIAAKDIQKGEELTEDYYSFDLSASDKLGKMYNKT